jgi:hypothetical protein
MKTWNVLVLSALLLGGTITHAANSAYEVIPDCQGEGCGCTRETKANKAFTLYKDMDEASKVVGSFKSGVAAKSVKALTQVIKAGKSEVTSVTGNVGLKKGDVVTHVFNMGEGHFKVRKDGKWVEITDTKVSLKDFEKPVYKTWYQLEVGSQGGYALVFPFLGCSE